jgi:hypothetical protein
MSLHYLKSGFESAQAHKGLAAIMYVGNLVMGLLLSIPIMVAFSDATATSGFSDEMADGFNLSVWADLMETSGPLVQTLIAQLFWILPVLFVWKMASFAGLIYAQGNGGGNSFWQGLGKYTGKSILLGMLFMVITVVVTLLVLVAVVVLSALLTGEVGSFWVQFVFTPLALVLGIALIDMMHDFGRIELILGRKGVMDSWFSGMRWPFQSANANSIYIGWMVLGLIFLFIPFMLDFSMGGLLLAFIVQQLLLYARAFITVGWIGSEVIFYEDMMPEVEPEPAPAHDADAETAAGLGSD